MLFDIIISEGRIVDGSGRAAFKGDVGIKEDRIRAVGDLTDAEAGRRINVGGLVVAPGFIDLHTHSDCTLLVNGAAESQVHQGVTLEVVGQCGFSAAPIIDEELGKRILLAYHPSIDVNWRSFGEYLDRLDSADLGLNVMSAVGHGTVFQMVMKGEMRSPNPNEIDAMVGLVETALEEGAVGFSTGLEYLPGSIAQPEEIFPLLTATQRHNALYETHVRNRDICYDLGFSEALAAARITGVRLQIAHIQPKFGAPDRAMEHTLEMIHWARESGADVCFDIFPHDWNHTGVSTALPSWAFEGGIDRLLNRLSNPEERQKMKYNPKPVWQLVAAGKWNDIVLFRSQKNKDLIGLTFEEIGRRRKVDPREAVFDLLLEEGEYLYDLMWTSHSFSEADVRLCLKQPECVVASDTMALAPYGLLKDTIGSLIGYGWTAQLFQKYVREETVITLEDAVYKLTGLPAQRLGLRDRGGLYSGAMADIVVFNPATIENLSTLTEPTRYPSGIEYVIVNGQTVIEKGDRTKTNPGQVIRRTD